MKGIKVIAPKGMSPENVDDILFKAISSKIEGSKSEKFQDPAIESITNNILKYHQEMYDELIEDIIKIIEE